MINIDHFKQKLTAEKSQLEADLGHISTQNIHQNKADWEAVPADKDLDIETRDEVADRLEDLSERQSATGNLETRLMEVNQALENIDKNTYGKCKVCKQDIEEARLEANPAATTCKAHLEE